MNFPGMHQVTFVGGPWDGRQIAVADPQPTYYAVIEADPFRAFKAADLPRPVADSLALRVEYDMVPGTDKPIIYACKNFRREIEVTNFIRKLGITLEPWQEMMLWSWLIPKVTATQMDTMYTAFPNEDRSGYYRIYERLPGAVTFVCSTEDEDEARKYLDGIDGRQFAVVTAEYYAAHGINGVKCL
jgi:hypothetical protein